MKMVIDQLEGILKELKDVAKELREVRFKISLHVSGFLGGVVSEEQGEEEMEAGGRRQEENVGARWVCFRSRLHLTKCEILSPAWRF